MTTLARAFAVSRASLAPRRRRARAMATREASYDALKRELATLNDLRSLEGLAGWDELVMMPSGDGAANARARAMATLAGVIHDKATSYASAPGAINSHRAFVNATHSSSTGANAPYSPLSLAFTHV